MIKRKCTPEQQARYVGLPRHRVTVFLSCVVFWGRFS